MSTSSAGVRERAEVLAEELMSTLLELGESTRGFEGSPVDLTLREALASLASLNSRAKLEQSSIDDLTRARSLLDRGVTLVEHAEARASLGEALVFLDALREQAIEELVLRDRSGKGTGPSDDAPSPGFVASTATPALHDGVVIATPQLFSRDLEPTAFIDLEEEDDLDAEPPSKRVASRFGDPGQRSQIEALARDAMEDLAAFSALRRLGDEEAWSTIEPFDKRLLASFDALVSLARPLRQGDAQLDLAEALYAYASEWAIPDRGRVFAFAFPLCSIASDVGLLWVTMALRRADPRVLASYVEAISLGSNPRISERILGLLSADVPRDLMTVALETAIRRRTFHPGAMLPLVGHPDVGIAALAARCLAFAPAEVAAEAVVTDGRPAVRAVLTSVAVVHRVPGAADLARAALSDALAAKDAAAATTGLRTLAILGVAADTDVVWRAAELVSGWREVGFFGYGALVPKLCAVLHHLQQSPEDESTDGFQERAMAQRSAAAAVRRITGIEASIRGDGTVDAADLATRCEASPIGPGRRRFGALHTSSAVTKEIGADETAQADRRLLALELCLLAGPQHAFDVDGWVADQRAAITAAAQSLG